MPTNNVYLYILVCFTQSPIIEFYNINFITCALLGFFNSFVSA